MVSAVAIDSTMALTLLDLNKLCVLKCIQIVNARNLTWKGELAYKVRKGRVNWFVSSGSAAVLWIQSKSKVDNWYIGGLAGTAACRSLLVLKATKASPSIHLQANVGFGVNGQRCGTVSAHRARRKPLHSVS